MSWTGIKYSKFGTTTPDEISEALGIKELILSGNKEQLNFWNQMNYPFLLDRSSTDLFKFIIDSGDNNKVSLALKDMVKDRQQIESNIKIYQSNILLIDKQIEDLKSKTKNSDLIIDNCNKIINLKDSINRLEKLKQIQERCLQNSNKINTLNLQYNNIINRMKLIIPKLKLILELYSNINKLNNNKIKISNIQNKVDVLKLKYNKMMKLPFKLELSINKYERLMNKYMNVKRITLKLESIKNINLPKVDWSFINIDKINKLKLYKNLIIDNTNSIKEKTEQIKLIKDLQLEVKNISNHIDICPICGHKIEKGTLL